MPRSEEAKDKLKQHGADEIFTESQLDVKSVKSLLVALLHALVFSHCSSPGNYYLVLHITPYVVLSGKRKYYAGLKQITPSFEIVITDY
jgi:hypothetical protein